MNLVASVLIVSLIALGSLAYASGSFLQPDCIKLSQRGDQAKATFKRQISLYRQFERLDPSLRKLVKQIKAISVEELLESKAFIIEKRPTYGPWDYNIVREIVYRPSVADRAVRKHPLSSIEVDSRKAFLHYVLKFVIPNIKNSIFKMVNSEHSQFVPVDSFVWSKPSAVQEKNEFGFNFLPVGYLGEDFTRKVLITLQVIQSLVEERLNADIKSLHDEEAALIGRTVRAYHSENLGLGRENDLSLIVQDGFLSVAQSLTYLLINRPDGVDADSEIHELVDAVLIEKVKEKSIINQWTKHLVFGFLGPSSLYGISDQLPALKFTDNKYELNPLVLAELQNMRRTLRNNDEFVLAEKIGPGCPFNRKPVDACGNDNDADSLVEVFASVFHYVFNAIH